VPDGDADALAAAMGSLMADADRRKAYGAAAVEGAARYDIAKIARRWETLFEEAAAAKGPEDRAGIAPALSQVTRIAAGRARRRLRSR